MNRELENYYLKQPEPIQSCLLALKSIVLNFSPDITHERKFQIPFFCYKGKKLAFLWVNRKRLIMGFVKDRALLPKPATGRRKDEFETIIVDPNEDLPIRQITTLLHRYMKLIP
jgi:hypothetical protein